MASNYPVENLRLEHDDQQGGLWLVWDERVNDSMVELKQRELTQDEYKAIGKMVRRTIDSPWFDYAS